MTLTTSARIPGALPVVGHLPWLRWRPLQFVERQRALGAVTSFTLRRHPAYLLNEPHLVWRLLTEHAGQVGRGRTGDKTRALTGNGLGSSDGDFHRQQRQLIQPVFQRQRVASYAPEFQRAAVRQASTWSEGESLDFVEQMLAISAAGVLTTLFGVRSPAGIAHEVSAALPSCLDIASRRAFASIKLPTTSSSRYAAALGRLHAVAGTLAEPDPHGAAGTPSGFLGRLRSAQREELPGLDDEQIHDEIMTMLVAGVETVATTASWTFHLLSRDPDSATRVHDELERVLGGRPVQADDLVRLTYLRRVVREALRLFPPVWLVRRRAAVSLDLGGQAVGVLQPVRPAPGPPLVPGARTFRSRPVASGNRTKPSAWLLRSLRRRSPPVRRRGLRHDRGHDDPGRPHSALAHRGHGGPGPAEGGGHATTGSDAGHRPTPMRRSTPTW